MDLSGTWSFQLDPEDTGIASAWYQRTLEGTIRLPGALQSQGYGEDPAVDSSWIGGIQNPTWYEDPRFAPYTTPENFKFPFWLQPEKVYAGPAWYQREVILPQEWIGQRVTLTLERPHWETRVWLDGRELGANDSLSTAHVYQLAGQLGTDTAPGAHRLTIRVDNRMNINVGKNSHSMSHHTQSNWNGIVGAIDLRASSPVWLEDVQVYPNLAEKSARVVLRLGSTLETAAQVRLTLLASLYNIPGQHTSPTVTAEISAASGQTALELEFPLGAEAQAWDEFHPALYLLQIDLSAQTGEDNFTSQRAVTFGLREIGVEGTQLTLNGRRIFMRGTLECAIFPHTGYPPTDKAAWERIIRICQGYGLNHIRFHSWCPPEAAFQAADELGFYYQVECASWANQGAAIGLGQPLDEWLYEEGRRITRDYGNHPSFLLMAYGNEPAGDIETYLTAWVEYWKARDSRRLYTSGAGWPAIAANQYHNVPEPRVQAWGAQLNSRINARPPETLTDYRDYIVRVQKPVISHEIGQWCVYPNFAEIVKYTGHLRAKNFEIFQESLEKQHMGDQAHDFLIASGKLQVLCYKEDIESALRTPGFAGFHLLDLHDFPGQGTALVGVLDPFWDDKGYVTAPEYSRFCNVTVPLARLAKRTWHTGETFQANIDIAHFGAQPLQGITPTWAITTAEGKTVASGSLPQQDVPIGNDHRLGSVQVPLAGFTPGQQYRLVVTLPGTTNQHGQPYENDWDLWVFAPQVETAVPQGVHRAHSLDAAALDALAQGGSVLLLLPPAQVQTDSVIGFSSMFWNNEWTNNQAPHTLGILVDPQHPLFASFPTQSHSNWQWWDLIHGAAAMQIDRLPAGLRPLIQPIDTWFHNRRLALAFEARVNGGRLLVASMDLESDLDQRPVARQLRRSLLDYLISPAFNPQQEVQVEDIRQLAQAG